MKKLSETLIELGIAFSFPIEIKDPKGNETYYEDSSGYWYKYEYDANGNQTNHENSNDYWTWREYDANGNVTYFEDSEGVKRGTPKSAKTCEGKVVEVDGIKYKLKAL
jgi:YD repeat-containing protein